MRRFIGQLKGIILYKWFPYFIDFLTMIATSLAARMLRNKRVKLILVDNTILSHSVTHETAWVDTGVKKWGNNEIKTGYLARIPVHMDSDDRMAIRSIRYLPGLAHLARQSVLTLCTSEELEDERWTQPTGRFRGYGLYDHSMFGDIRFKKFEDPDYSMVIGQGYPSLVEQRRKRLERKSDELYRNLVVVLGRRNSQDAWHIATAEHNACYCFLTMDFHLIRTFRAQAKNNVISSLRTKVLTPEEFGKEFGIFPLPPRWFSYHNASYPVIYNTNWPDSERQGRGKRSGD
jgi:hypothetical protein